MVEGQWDQTSDFVFPGSQVPDDYTLPDGDLVFNCESMVPQTSKNGYKQIKVTMRGIAPEGVAGLPHFQTWTLGTEVDPHFQSPDSWRSSAGARDFKRFLKTAGLPTEGRMSEIAGYIANVQIGVDSTVYLDDGKYNPAYKGTPRNRLRWYQAGTRSPQLRPNAIVTSGAPAPGPLAHAQATRPPTAGGAPTPVQYQIPPAQQRPLAPNDPMAQGGPLGQAAAAPAPGYAMPGAQPIQPTVPHTAAGTPVTPVVPRQPQAPATPQAQARIRPQMPPTAAATMPPTQGMAAVPQAPGSQAPTVPGPNSQAAPAAAANADLGQPTKCGLCEMEGAQNPYVYENDLNRHLAEDHQNAAIRR